MPQVHQAPSTTILDVQQVTPGGRRLFTVLSRGSYTNALHNGKYSDVFDLGDWSFLQLMMDIFATSVTDAGDVMDLSVQRNSSTLQDCHRMTLTGSCSMTSYARPVTENLPIPK